MKRRAINDNRSEKKQKIHHQHVTKKSNPTPFPIMDLPEEMLCAILIDRFCLYPPEPCLRPWTMDHGPCCHAHIAIAISVCHRWRDIVLGVLRDRNLMAVGETCDPEAPHRWVTIPKSPRISVVAMECAFYGYTKFIHNIAKLEVARHPTTLGSQLLHETLFFDNICWGQSLETFKEIYAAWYGDIFDRPSNLARRVAIQFGYLEMYEWLYEHYLDRKDDKGRACYETFISEARTQEALQDGHVHIAKWIVARRREHRLPATENFILRLIDCFGADSIEAFRFVANIIRDEGRHASVLVQVDDADPQYYTVLLQNAIFAPSLALKKEAFGFFGITDAEKRNPEGVLDMWSRVVLDDPSDMNTVATADLESLKFTMERIGSILTVHQKLFVLSVVVRKGMVENLKYFAHTVLGLTKEHFHRGWEQDTAAERREIARAVTSMWQWAIESQSLAMLRAVDALPYPIPFRASHIREYIGNSELRYPISNDPICWLLEAARDRFDKGDGEFVAHQIVQRTLWLHAKTGDVPAMRELMSTYDTMFPISIPDWARQWLGNREIWEAAIGRNDIRAMDYLWTIARYDGYNNPAHSDGDEMYTDEDCIDRALRAMAGDTPVTRHITPKTLKWLLDRDYNIFRLLKYGDYVKCMNPIVRRFFSQAIAAIGTGS